MSPRKVTVVSDMEIDEVSFVDRPANPHASVVIAKSLRGETMAEETGYFWEDGQPVMDDDPIGPDDVVYDAQGEGFQIPEEEFQLLEDEASQGELVGAEIGKAFFTGTPRGPVQKSLVEELRETLQKSVADEDTKTILAKALGEITKADQRASAAEEIAKAERELRLDREFYEVAKNYGALPVSPEELAPVLKRCAQYLPDEDCAVLHKAFTATGEILFQELGMTGGGTADGSDPMAIAEAAIEGTIQKSADGTKVSKAEAVVDYFTAHPEAYDAYTSTLGQR